MGAKEVYKILFDEFMNMIADGLAGTKYLVQNTKQSGLEIRRKLHYWNEPTTFGSEEFYRRKVEALGKYRCNNYPGLSKRFEEFEAAIIAQSRVDLFEEGPR